MRSSLLSGLLLLLTAAGCLAPGPAPSARHFRPARPEDVALMDGPGPALRLRRVESSAHLRERMVWRSSDVEFGYHELRRWTEQPAVFVDQALTHVLFESGAAQRSDRAGETSLLVTLVGFEEVLRPERRAYVELAVRLDDPQGQTLLERRYSGTRGLGKDDPAALAAAMGEALHEVVTKVARDVLAVLTL